MNPPSHDVAVFIGRFQPFHNGHLDYLRRAAERSDEVFVGITNPDPARIKPEAADPLRHLPESNPFSYVERLLMVKAAAADARRSELPHSQFHQAPGTAAILAPT